MPPRKKAPAGPTPVDAIVHGDKRANLPLADAPEWDNAEVEQPVTLRYPRDPSLDPQLVWKGKDELDGEDLAVPAPPIYIQEKIDPRVLIEDLRTTAGADEVEPELTLFESFDGLDELDLVDYYRHDANWSNRMILGDSLQVMASLAERERLRGKVQMIFVDPPYGIRFGSNWQFSISKRTVQDGKHEDASREVEQIKAFRDTWELGIHSYLAYLRDRLVAARDLLAPSGSIFVQIGDENIHLVRSLMDETFGSSNFVSLITYVTTGGTTGGLLPGTADFILWYAADREQVKYRQLYRDKAVGGAGAAKYDSIQTADGSRRRMTSSERSGGALPANARPYRLDTLTSPRIRGSRSGYFPVEIAGRTVLPTSGEWKTHREGIKRLMTAGRVEASSNSLNYVRFIDDFAAFPLTGVWGDIGGVQSRADPKIYVVQTSTSAVQRCMLMTTDPGDLILDPTCGAGTTAYVAEQWGRRWITVDTSRVALALARQRLMGARYPYYLIADSVDGRKKEEGLTGQQLPPTMTTGDIRQGFVYGRVRHVTLKSIANNPDIVEGMSRDEVDEAIRRHAEFEMLYDKPYEDARKVRVTGPFTLESLSPHRSLAFAPSDEPTAERDAALDPSAETFEQMILANLQAAGIQNGRRQERIDLDMVESYAGTHIQSVAIREGAEGGTPSRIGISIGPQYGTVGPSFIKAAAKEAIAAGDIDLLCVLAFAFDPTVIKDDAEYSATAEGFANVAAERSLGKVPVLLVRMNADLVMGEELKKTGAGNLFTVFGEPDIQLTETPDGLVVEIKGVDVYDPTTGEVRSRDTDRIALWMLDTSYNGESFFVRHCYFTGGNDPYARLKKALKADIAEDAWATLNSTTSRPFPKPDTGRIAIKVINDYGDEVMKVIET